MALAIVVVPTETKPSLIYQTNVTDVVTINIQKYYKSITRIAIEIIMKSRTLKSFALPVMKLTIS